VTKNSSHPYLARLFSWRPGALAKNTFFVTGGLSIRALLQFFLFVGLARFLGVRGYGEFVAVVAVITFLVPLVGFGTPILLVREVALDKNRFARQFGKSLVVIGGSAVPFLVVSLIVADWLLPKEIARIIILNIALAELFLGPVIELSGRAFQALERLVYMMVIATGLILFRLIGFGLMVLGDGPIDAANWSNYYLIATALATVGALLLVFKRIGLPELSSQGVFATMREGFYYALTGATSRINGEIDKVFLARLTSLRITGAYAAAYRFIDIILLPISALLESSAARFFREGKNGVTSSGVYAKKLLPIPSLYAALGGLLLFFGADFIPLLLGPGYIISVPILKWLAILPLILTIRSFFSLVVVTGGRIRYTSMVFFAGALVNVGLNLCLIPLYSWAGAALATIIAELVMIFLLWLVFR
jgi:O-antigen/teichoic acid export membrane protein